MLQHWQGAAAYRDLGKTQFNQAGLAALVWVQGHGCESCSRLCGRRGELCSRHTRSAKKGFHTCVQVFPQAAVTTSKTLSHPLSCVVIEAGTSYGGASTATAVEVQGNGSKALLIDVNGATKAGVDSPHSTWLKPLSAAMLTCCALAAGVHSLLGSKVLDTDLQNDANTVPQPINVFVQAP